MIPMKHFRSTRYGNSTVFPKRGVSAHLWPPNAVFVFPQWSWRCDVWRRNIRSDRLPVSPSNWNRWWWCVTHTRSHAFRRSENWGSTRKLGPLKFTGKCVQYHENVSRRHGIFYFHFYFSWETYVFFFQVTVWLDQQGSRGCYKIFEAWTIWFESSRSDENDHHADSQ